MGDISGNPGCGFSSLSFFFECRLIVSNKPVKANAVNRKLYPMAKKKKKTTYKGGLCEVEQEKPEKIQRTLLKECAVRAVVRSIIKKKKKIASKIGGIILLRISGKSEVAYFLLIVLGYL